MHAQRGTSFPETAVSMLLTLMVLFGIIYCAQLLFTYHLVTNAARLGSRYAMVHGSLCTAPCSTASANDVRDYVRAQTPGLDSSSLSVATTWSSTTDPNSACSNSGTNEPGHVVCVTVSYPYSFAVPLIPSAALTISSTSRMVISQ